jgi:spermidine/putrescine-binding protein
MKKTKLILALTLVCSLVFTACGTKDDNNQNGKAASNPTGTNSTIKDPETKELSGSVYVYNWGEYIDPDVADMFQEETGITVYYSEFEQNEDMYPIIETGAVQYDVVCPSDYMIEKMIKNDLLAKINYDNIPNLANIDPTYLKTAENFDPGNLYSVPYCWGTVGILYNKTMVDEPIDSWDVLFDEKYKDNILMIDSVRDAYMIALITLGYDQNTTDEAQIDEATEVLKNQYPLVQAYVIDQVREKMIGEEAAIGVIYSGEAIFTQRENEDLEYVVPKEGSNVWIDGWVIPKNCQNKENAEAWINFLCREDIALKNFDYITYSTPNKAAKALIEDEEIRNSLIAFPTQDILDTCKSFNYLGEDVEALYLNKWLEVKN